MSKDYIKYDALDFTNDFLFCKILVEHPDLCKELLEIILEVKIKDLVYLNKQETIEITSDGRGIRLDVYVEDDEKTVYDIEMQATTSVELPKRSRYYQGMIDLNLIERGAKYRELKKSIVIFICLKDPFDKGLYVYHFTNRCKEILELELNDETEKVFLNASGTKGNISQELKNFLNYLVLRKVNSEFTNKIEEAVIKTREREEWRLEYMTLHQRELEKYEEGLQEGLQLSLRRLIKKVDENVLSMEDAAEIVDMTVEEFQQKMKELTEN